MKLARSSLAARSRCLSLLLSPIAPLPLPLLQRLLQGFKPLGKLLLLLCLQRGAHGPYVGVDGLDGDGRHVRLKLALEETAAYVGVLVFEVGQLRDGPATAPALAALVGRPAPIVGVVGMVGVAVARTVDSYTPTTVAAPRYRRAFSQ